MALLDWMPPPSQKILEGRTAPLLSEHPKPVQGWIPCMLFFVGGPEKSQGIRFAQWLITGCLLDWKREVKKSMTARQQSPGTDLRALLNITETQADANLDNHVHVHLLRKLCSSVASEELCCCSLSGAGLLDPLVARRPPPSSQKQLSLG